MRYHYSTDEHAPVRHGVIHICNHPVYSRCTLFRIGELGLAVIQQRFEPVTKSTCWTEIDQWLNDPIRNNAGFLLYFKQHAGIVKNGLYPTVTVRQIMWALKMKPLKKEPWETTFDHCPV